MLLWGRGGGGVEESHKVALLWERGRGGGGEEESHTRTQGSVVLVERWG